MTAEQRISENSPRDIPAVIGSNAKRLRGKADLTLDQVSIAARGRGLSWSESRVADFEAGRVAPNLATLFAFCLALADAGCAKVGIAQLLQSVPPIRINDDLLMYDVDLEKVLTGRAVPKIGVAEQGKVGGAEPPGLAAEEWKIAEYFPVEDFASLVAVRGATGATEERVCKALGVTPMLLAYISASRWGITFSQERDRRAGQHANPQRRGQVTRQMRTEVAAAIQTAKHGDDK
jgi:transcriptional regulator with XRE-family HTH domain